MNKDLTQGKPFSILWRFVVPMLISVVFQQFYNIADSVIAGRFINQNALSAIGASYPITMLFMQVANGFNAGCAVIISQTFGAKKRPHLKCAVSTSVISASVLSLILTAGGVILCRPILLQLDTPADILNDSQIYLNIYFYGMFFMFIYNTCNGIFTALGDSKTPLYFLIFSSIFNVILSTLFVTVVDFGLAGIAWATFIAQGIAAILSFIVLMRRIHRMNLVRTHKIPKFSPKTLRKLTLVSVPAILQSSFVSVGNIMVQAVINSMGAAAVAGFSVGFRLNVFAITSMGTAANGVASFTAQNIGAQKLDRVPRGFKAGLMLEIIIVLPFVLAFVIAPQFFTALFMDNGNAVTQTAAEAAALIEAMNISSFFVRVCAPFYLILATKLVCDCILRGAGSMKTFMIATFVDLLLRVIMVYALNPFIGEYSLCIGWITGWTISSVLSMVFYKQGRWKRHAI
ncbi:MAG: MATE family efflux transporter [Ruminococcus sp.]|jgi:putative MATE family efflux protein|nr:MATE family efflux transporter [Ruminococcus sp.]